MLLRLSWIASSRSLLAHALLVSSLLGCVSSRQPDPATCDHGSACDDRHEAGPLSLDSASPPRPVTTLAAGPVWNCAIQEDKKVDCWGEDSGIRDTLPTDVEFQQVATGSLIARIACGVTLDNSVRCWGNKPSQPEFVKSGTEYIQVVIGTDVACGLTDDFHAECSNLFGRSKIDAPASEFTQLAAGMVHVCGLRRDGTAECWGVRPSDTCTALNCGQANPPADRFVQLAAGRVHSCGLRADGTVKCWGLGSRETSYAADLGQALPPEGVAMSSITAGDFHTCGIRADNGEAMCWGAGVEGASGAFDFGQAAPPSGVRFLSLTAGVEHTCGLTTEREITCWGHNTRQQCDAPLGTFPAEITAAAR